MRVIIVADVFTLLVQYTIISSVGSGSTAISFDIVEATMRTADGGRVTLDAKDRADVMQSLGRCIEGKVVEHSQGMYGFDAWYATQNMPTDTDAKMTLEEALLLARAAYDAGQLSVAEVRDERCN